MLEKGRNEHEVKVLLRLAAAPVGGLPQPDMVDGSMQ